jgi:hypothetical protein
MARALLATALAQALVAVIALIAGTHHAPFNPRSSAERALRRALHRIRLALPARCAQATGRGRRAGGLGDDGHTGSGHRVRRKDAVQPRGPGPFARRLVGAVGEQVARDADRTAPRVAAVEPVQRVRAADAEEGVGGVVDDASIGSRPAGASRTRSPAATSSPTPRARRIAAKPPCADASGPSTRK